jgi:hypothetical protein
MSLEAAESEHIHWVGEDEFDILHLLEKYYTKRSQYFGLSNFDQIQEIVGDWAQRKGWNEKERDAAEWCMLLVTEAAEAYEEHRNGVEPQTIYFLKDDKGVMKPEGPAVEHADAVIRHLHWFAKHSLSLADVICLKMAYNETREHRHGGKRA